MPWPPLPRATQPRPSSLRRPQVLWLGIEDEADELDGLASFVDHAIRVAGFGLADKKFKGHLTLGRVGRGRRAPDLEQLTAGLTPPAGPLRIHAITLFKSDLRPDGPRYTALEIAQPRSSPGETGSARSTESSSLPPRARRTGQDPDNMKEGEPKNG